MCVALGVHHICFGFLSNSLHRIIGRTVPVYVFLRSKLIRKKLQHAIIWQLNSQIFSFLCYCFDNDLLLTNVYMSIYLLWLQDSWKESYTDYRLYRDFCVSKTKRKKWPLNYLWHSCKPSVFTLMTQQDWESRRGEVCIMSSLKVRKVKTLTCAGLTVPCC